jgi:hypothetical protein
MIVSVHVGRTWEWAVVEYLKVLLGKDSAILGYYASRSGNSLPTFEGQPVGPIFKGQ